MEINKDSDEWRNVQRLKNTNDIDNIELAKQLLIGTFKMSEEQANFEVQSRDITELLGKIFVSVIESGDELKFIDKNGNGVLFYHIQDCCESVQIEDIEGDLKDLEGKPILQAQEVIRQGNENDYESQTWTFYKFATIKGYVTVRWIGESNGYYSESVDIETF